MTVERVLYNVLYNVLYSWGVNEMVWCGPLVVHVLVTSHANHGLEITTVHVRTVMDN